MEWEVIPIGDSSSEETGHKAFDSRSSSFLRLLDPRHVDEGSSQPHEIVLPYVAPLGEEPIPIITILPSSPSAAKRRGDSGVVRVSPCNRHSHSARMSSPPPFIAGYELVRVDVLKHRSSITFVMSIVTLWRQLELAKLEDSRNMIVQACGEDEFSFMRAA